LRALLEISPHALENWPFVKAIPLPTITVIGASIGDGEAQQIEAGTFYLWCYLTVFYNDILGQCYEMRIRFRYDPKNDSFSMLQGDEYIMLDEKGSTP
jgi:hypothetical protein